MRFGQSMQLVEPFSSPGKRAINLGQLQKSRGAKIHCTYLPRQGEDRAIKQAGISRVQDEVAGFVSIPGPRQDLNQGLAFAVKLVSLFH